MLNLNLCWKTCDQRVLEYFKFISPDKTIGEAKFLTEIFLSGNRPLPYRKLKNHFKSIYSNNRHTNMARHKLLYISDYDKGGGLCRTYSLNDKTRRDAVLYFLLSQVSMNFQSKSYSYVRNTSCKVNRVSEFLMKKQIEFRISTLNSLIDEASDTGRVIEPRLINDTQTVLKMLSRANPYTDSDQVIYIDRKLKASDYGRIYEIDGGTQNLSRKSKKLNYCFDNVFNYDIRSCALSALILFCEQLKIPCQAIKDYVNDPSAKYRYAEKAGLSVATWKQCILSAIFGAKIDGLGSISANIKEEVGFRNVNESFVLFKKVAEPLLTVITSWLNKVQSYAESRVDLEGMIENDTGCKIPLKLNGKIQDKKKLSSFYLQGLECSFIYDLILASTDVFEILSYEFDGLVTRGVIPISVIDKCKSSSGFHNAVLEIKEF